MKRLPAFVRTTTFRITLFVAFLYALSTIFLLVFVYQSTIGALSRQTDVLITQEISSLSALYRANGINGVNRGVVERSAANTSFLYLFTGVTGERVSGNLNGLPANAADQSGFFGFSYQLGTGTGEGLVDHRARARLIRLPNNYLLLVATDIEEQAQIAGKIAKAMWIGAIFVLVLGLISGALISRRFANRVEALNEVARDVMAGDLQRRAPRNHSNDELDELSENLNQMLSRIESLMASSKYAGDAIAHDLRSPLTRMQARLEQATRDNNPKSGDVIQKTLNDAEELLKIFNAIQRISQLESGEQRSVFKLIDPAPIIEDIAELYGPVCEEEGRQFDYEVERGLQIRADRGLLAQALSNLVDNAVKYTDSDGAITLRLRRRRDGKIEISVTDTGPGIPADKREAVLKRFVRLEGSRSRPGSGLGLSMVNAIAKIHSASLLLEDGAGSNAEGGKGLRIALVFPKRRKSSSS
jgi:signal transduction histidine kinase